MRKRITIDRADIHLHEYLAQTTRRVVASRERAEGFEAPIFRVNEARQEPTTISVIMALNLIE